MISNILFLLPFIASCNGLWKSTRYNMDGQGSCKEGRSADRYVVDKDHEEDKEIFTETELEKLDKRLTELETYFNKERNKEHPHYSEGMAYLKKLCMEHFNTIDKVAFYSDPYAEHTADLYWKNIHILLPIAVCSGSELIVNGFLSFLKKKGINTSLKGIILL